MAEGLQERRIDLLWAAVKAIRTPASPWRTAVFNDHFRWTTLETVPEPRGTTNLTDALDALHAHHPSVVTLITDGEPNEMGTALTAAVALECPVNILYVGDHESLGTASYVDALEFCRLVCRRTGGTFATDVLTLQSVQTVSRTVQKMLAAEATKPSAIPLGG